MPVEDYFTPGSREWYEAKLYGMGNAEAGAPNVNALAETALGLAPGSGEAMSARDAWQASGRGANALAQGQYGQAAGEYANMLAATLGAIPGAGIVARGTRRGAAWMERNLPKGINALADRMMPSDPANTLNAFPAWHGSPHDFDEFKLDKIGTGEGAQVYGHGLYFAENPEVARSYQSALGGTDVHVDGKPFYVGGKRVGTTGDPDIDRQLVMTNGDIGAALHSKLQVQRLMRQNNPAAADAMEPVIQKLRNYQGQIERKPGGKLYHTEIDAEPEDLLDWDKRLSQQSEKVQNALKSRFGDFPTWTGRDIYQAMAPHLGDVAASKMLAELGIPGIRYLDQGSRGAGGTSNYVVFDDKLVKVLNKE